MQDLTQTSLETGACIRRLRYRTVIFSSNGQTTCMFFFYVCYDFGYWGCVELVEQQAIFSSDKLF